MLKNPSRNPRFESSRVGHGQVTQRQKLGSFCPAESGTFVQRCFEPKRHFFTTRFDEALSASEADATISWGLPSASSHVAWQRR